MTVVVSVCASAAGGGCCQCVFPLSRCLAFPNQLDTTIDAFGGFRGPIGTKYIQITGGVRHK